MTESPARDLDIVLVGATGFVGRLTAQHLRDHAPAGLRIGLAGRSRAKLDTLAADTAHYAAKAGVTVTKVAIGDARGRWGSCAGDGVIRYSWRLILAPREVLDYVAAHEVAHLAHMDHSPAFWAARPPAA